MLLPVQRFQVIRSEKVHFAIARDIREDADPFDVTRHDQSTHRLQSNGVQCCSYRNEWLYFDLIARVEVLLRRTSIRALTGSEITELLARGSVLGHICVVCR